MVRKATVAHPNVSIEEEVELHVNDIPYVLIPQSTSFVSFNSEQAPCILFVAYPTQPGDTISQETLSAFRSEVLDLDDVFQSEFARTIVFHGSSESEVKLDSNATEGLARWGATSRVFEEGNGRDSTPPGPLDSPEAGIDGRVIVPSRCYFKPSPSRPLDGVRVGLLIDAGASIVGKRKLQALTVREEPVEAVEFTDPFNPRCDGYQVPSGSSSGSAAAIGSYDWLDLSLGSDTNGSVRNLLTTMDAIPYAQQQVS
ncbi:unnamed protein product, partial [Clonostachys rhizophaga]